MGKGKVFYYQEYFSETSPEDILEDREKRAIKQSSLISFYNKTLITLRVNYPGLDKNNQFTFGIIKEIMKKTEEVFFNKIVFKDFQISAEGPIAFFIVDDNPVNVKLKCIDIEENHSLGRLLDIDVYEEEEKSISRVSLGYSRRKCFLCNEEAQVCVRSRRHKEEDIKTFIKDLYFEYFSY